MMPRESLAFRMLVDVARQRADIDELRCRSVLELLSTSTLIRADLRKELARLALTELDFGVLAALFALDPAGATPADLAAHVGTARSAVGEVLDRLEQRKLIRRDRDARDRRLVYVQLDGAGRQLADQAVVQILTRIAEIARQVATAAAVALPAVCQQLNAGTERLHLPNAP